MWSRLKDRRPRPKANPPASRPPVSPRSAFVLGVLSVFVIRVLVNGTSLPDLLVRPLVLADRTQPADAIVVLGAGVTARCSPNLSGIRRVLLAGELYRRGLAPYVVFTGGRSEGSPCAISGAMADFARLTGIPADRVYIEAASTSTWENAQFSQPVLEKLQARRLLLVTDRLHVRRAVITFAHLGYAVDWAGVPVSDTLSDNVSMLYWGSREYAALLYYRMRIGLGETQPGMHSAAGAPGGRKN